MPRAQFCRVACFALLAGLSSLSARAAPVDSCPGIDDVGELVAPGTVAAGLQAKASTAVTWMAFDPIVILPSRNPASPVLLRARATGAPDSLQLQFNAGGPALSLLDNGLAPDAAAADGVYSVHVPTPEILQRNVPARYGRPILGSLRAVVAGVAQSAAYNVIYDVAPADLPAYPITLRAGAPFDYRSTSHVLNYVDATFHADRNIAATVMRILPRVGDHHDFVDVISPQRGYFENRFHATARNDVAGIGLNIYDNGAQFGSPARLRGYSMFPNLTFYDPQARDYNHEIGHQWINFLLGTLDDTVNAHWPVGPLAQSIMGTSGVGGQGINLNCLLTRSGGTVSATGQPGPAIFSPYELYLMGFLAPAGVPASWQFADQAAARNLIAQPGWCNGTIALATTDIGLQTMVGANGVRSPAAGQAPRYFTVATLAVGIERLLDDTELRYLNWLARRGDVETSLPSTTGLGNAETGMNFFLATGGRARLDFRLPAVFRDTFD